MKQAEFVDEVCDFKPTLALLLDEYEEEQHDALHMGDLLGEWVALRHDSFCSGGPHIRAVLEYFLVEWPEAADARRNQVSHSFDHPSAGWRHPSADWRNLSRVAQLLEAALGGCLEVDGFLSRFVQDTFDRMDPEGNTANHMARVLMAWQSEMEIDEYSPFSWKGMLQSWDNQSHAAVFFQNLSAAHGHKRIE
jgi:hypothetical protein